MILIRVFTPGLIIYSTVVTGDVEILNSLINKINNNQERLKSLT